MQKQIRRWVKDTNIITTIITQAGDGINLEGLIPFIVVLVG